LDQWIWVKVRVRVRVRVRVGVGVRVRLRLRLRLRLRVKLTPGAWGIPLLTTPNQPLTALVPDRDACSSQPHAPPHLSPSLQDMTRPGDARPLKISSPACHLLRGN